MDSGKPERLASKKLHFSGLSLYLAAGQYGFRPGGVLL